MLCEERSEEVLTTLLNNKIVQEKLSLQWQGRAQGAPRKEKSLKNYLLK